MAWFVSASGDLAQNPVSHTAGADIPRKPHGAVCLLPAPGTRNSAGGGPISSTANKTHRRFLLDQSQDGPPGPVPTSAMSQRIAAQAAGVCRHKNSGCPPATDAPSTP